MRLVRTLILVVGLISVGASAAVIELLPGDPNVRAKIQSAGHGDEVRLFGQIDTPWFEVKSNLIHFTSAPGVRGGFNFTSTTGGPWGSTGFGIVSYNGNQRSIQFKGIDVVGGGVLLEGGSWHNVRFDDVRWKDARTVCWLIGSAMAPVVTGSEFTNISGIVGQEQREAFLIYGATNPTFTLNRFENCYEPFHLLGTSGTVTETDNRYIATHRIAMEIQDGQGQGRDTGPRRIIRHRNIDTDRFRYWGGNMAASLMAQMMPTDGLVDSRDNFADMRIRHDTREREPDGDLAWQAGQAYEFAGTNISSVNDVVITNKCLFPSSYGGKLTVKGFKVYGDWVDNDKQAFFTVGGPNERTLNINGESLRHDADQRAAVRLNGIWDTNLANAPTPPAWPIGREQPTPTPTPSPTPNPTPPMIALSGEALSTTTIKLTWPNADARIKAVKVVVSGNNQRLADVAIASNATTVEIGGLERTWRYTFTLIDGAGAAISAPREVQTMIIEPPTPPATQPIPSPTTQPLNDNELELRLPGQDAPSRYRRAG